MNITSSLLRGLCVAVFLSFGLYAQDNTPPKRNPQLTMDDFDNRTAAPASTSPTTVSNDSPGAIKPGKNAVTPTRAYSSAGISTILSSAWNKIANMKSGRVQMTHRPASGQATTFLCEFAGDDRMRVVKEEGEIIVIATARYIKPRGQEWQQLPPMEAGKTQELSFKTIAKNFIDSPSEVQFLGEETLNQVPVLKLKLTDKNRDTGYTWIGKDDGLVYMVEGAASSNGGYVKMIFSDHNASISITPPVR